MRANFLGAAAALSATAAQAAGFSTLYTWPGTASTYVAGRPVVSGGNLFGVMGAPSAPAGGSVYSLPAAAASATPTTIYTFSSGYPAGGLVADSAGTLYGATLGGGSTTGVCANTGYGGCGTIYKLTKPVSGTTWALTTLVTFKGGSDGLGPVGNLVADASGALYGVTQGGGCTATVIYGYGCGTVFRLTPPAAGQSTWTYTQLYAFKGGATDGAVPAGTLAVDTLGNIYGATLYGGTAAPGCATLPSGGPDRLPFSPDARCGTVFMLTKGASGYTESVAHFFADGADGSIPAGGVVRTSTGILYGTTTQGGSTGTGALCPNLGYSGCGTVFKLVKLKTGAWQKTLVHNFTGADGQFPMALSLDKKNHLFGLTSLNSAAMSCGAYAYYCGTAFKLTVASAVWTFTTLHGFTGGTDNAGPQFGLAGDTLGNLYGVAVLSTSSVFAITAGGFIPALGAY